MDPRLKSMPWLDAAEKESVHEQVVANILKAQPTEPSVSEVSADKSVPDPVHIVEKE